MDGWLAGWLLWVTDTGKFAALLDGNSYSDQPSS
jgi:hypothetical protein